MLETKDETLKIQLDLIFDTLGHLYSWSGDPCYLCLGDDLSSKDRLHNIKYLKTIKTKLVLEQNKLTQYINDLEEEHNDLLNDEVNNG